MVAVREERHEKSPTALLHVVERGRSPRRDALPEHTQYTDSGCSIHVSCLNCPLVRCRYDEPGGARKLLSEDRDRDILNLRSEGRPVSAIATRFGISRRTVFRVLAHDRRG
jgi:hypothetical protein